MLQIMEERVLASLISRDYFEINDYIDSDIIENYENMGDY
jgi:hypothetical protein